MNDDAEQMVEEGYAARRSGAFELALERYQAAVAALRSMSSPQRLAHAIRHVADIQRGLDQAAAAEDSYAEALARYRTDPATGKLDLANTLRGYALLREEASAFAAAREMWSEARELYRAVDVQAGVDEADRRIELFKL